jgi:hypothetical protein
MRCAFAFLALTLGLSFSAAAEETRDRYEMTPSGGGVIRLDKETGAVSFCVEENGSVSCRLGADERAALENEIARLRRENAELSAAAKGAVAPPDDQLERALTLTERFFRRFLKLFKGETSGERI